MHTARHRKTTIALGLALCALAAPMANANVVPPDPHCSTCGYSVAAPPASSSARPAIVRVESRGGFDWADAGIGAAGALALAPTPGGITPLARPTPPRAPPTSAP